MSWDATLGFFVLVLLAVVGLGSAALGAHRLRSDQPGLTGIKSRPWRFLAWMISGTEIRLDGMPRRWAVSNTVAGSLHLLLGGVFLIVVVAGSIALFG